MLSYLTEVMLSVVIVMRSMIISQTNQVALLP